MAGGSEPARPCRVDTSSPGRPAACTACSARDRASACVGRRAAGRSPPGSLLPSSRLCRLRQVEFPASCPRRLFEGDSTSMHVTRRCSGVSLVDFDEGLAVLLLDEGPHRDRFGSSALRDGRSARFRRRLFAAAIRDAHIRKKGTMSFLPTQRGPGKSVLRRGRSNAPERPRAAHLDLGDEVDGNPPTSRRLRCKGPCPETAISWKDPP